MIIRMIIRIAHDYEYGPLLIGSFNEFKSQKLITAHE